MITGSKGWNCCAVTSEIRAAGKHEINSCLGHISCMRRASIGVMVREN